MVPLSCCMRVAGDFYPYHFGEVPFYDALRVGVVGSVVCDGVVCRLRYS